MSTDRNKDIVRRIYEEVLNKRDLDLLDEIVRTDYIENDPLPGQSEGIPGMKERYSMLFSGLDPQFTIEDIIAEGDKVVVRWVNHGTNVGEFLGAPPTGKSFATPGVDIYRLEDGKFAEHWHVVDVFGQMVQLGQLPAPGGS